jgi:large subunit ribosomal protein L22
MEKFMSQIGKATHYGAACTPRKLRLLREVVLNKNLVLAVALLSAENRAGSRELLKVIRSASAQLTGHSPANMIVKEVVVGEGPKRRSFMPRAQGRASPVIKRSSHVSVKVVVA